MTATPNNSSRDDLQPAIISSNSFVSAAALLPLPKAPPQSTRRTRFGKMRIWTRTPEKIALEEKEKEKQRKKSKMLFHKIYTTR